MKDWKCHMSGSAEHSDNDVDPQPSGQGYEILYWAKHRAYEFFLAMPTSSPTFPSAGSAVVQLWFKGQPHEHGIVLTLPELESFCDALSRLREYVERERENRQRPHT
jgi:hypothetical protein